MSNRNVRRKLFELANVEEDAAGAQSRCLPRIAVGCATEAAIGRMD